MLTIDDMRAVSLFSTLAAPELELLAQTSADIHLAAGGQPCSPLPVLKRLNPPWPQSAAQPADTAADRS